jgi:hypothetical protein
LGVLRKRFLYQYLRFRAAFFCFVRGGAGSWQGWF